MLDVSKLGSKERKKVLQEKLNELASNLITDVEKLKEFARNWSAGFHHYSFYNLLLIWCQKPKATLCAGFKQWIKKHKRFVRKGEKALWILAPIFKKEKKVEEIKDADGNVVETKEKEIDKLVGFTSVPVFDVSQTEGEALDIGGNNVKANGELPNVEEIGKKFGFPVRISQGVADGWTNGKEIVLCERKNKAQMVACFFHELGHNLCGHLKDRKDVSRERAELEAEAVSFLVCSCLNIENNNSASYISCWKGDREKIEQSAYKVLGASEKILKKVLDK